MISKVAPVKSASAFNIKKLAEYLKTGHKDEPKQEVERVKKFFNFNLYSDDLDTATQEMMYTASLNERSKKSKYMHLVLSLSPDEKLTDEQWQNVAKDYLKEVGMEGHQCIAVKHDDNGKEHLHLVINRINTDTHARVDDKWKLFKHLQKFDEKIEQKYNLKQFDHNPNYEKKAERKAKNIESKSEHQSFISYLLEHKEDILKANSWQNLHERLRKINCEIRVKGRGLVIKSLDPNNQEEIKASTFDRDFSYAKLVKKFGLFKSFIDDDDLDEEETKAEHSYTKKPITKNAKRIEYSKYLIKRIEERNDKVIDKGNRLIEQKADDYRTVQDMLKIAKKRFGDGNTKINGDADFQRRVAYQALKMGIKVQLTDETVKKDYELKLQRQEFERKHQTTRNKSIFRQKYLEQEQIKLQQKRKQQVQLLQQEQERTRAHDEQVRRDRERANTTATKRDKSFLR